tara:strand:+ start:805 stop:1308 length:504 start_codon:yes stop_codon:yes gene_type:complete
MKITRSWCMPNKNTFDMKPARNVIYRHLKIHDHWLDPFARNSHIATVTNDVNENTQAEFHFDALEFLQMQQSNSADGVLFDPPYSLRQVKECYNNIGKAFTQRDSQYFYSDIKKEISRIIKPGGKCISFGWSSNGIGKTRGFEIKEILLLSHGGNHNDTIITVEEKK